MKVLATLSFAALTLDAQATVTFDEPKTSVGALTHATRDADYPSNVGGSAQ